MLMEATPAGHFFGRQAALHPVSLAKPFALEGVVPMNVARIRWSRETKSPTLRRGAVLVSAAMLMVVVMGFMALAMDVGYIMLTRSQLQNAADSAAMAAAWEILDDRLLHSANAASLRSAAVAVAERYIAQHQAGGKMLQGTGKNISFGSLTPSSEFAVQDDCVHWNSVKACVGRTDDNNGPVTLLFAPLIGSKTANVSATAVATFRGDIIGFRPTPKTSRTTVIPFTIDVIAWNLLQKGIGADNWSYDANGQLVRSGSDGFPELLLFPSETGAPGNFGTIAIGGGGNTTLIQQILNGGLTQADLQAYGGELCLDSTTGTLQLSGDTGATTDIMRAAETLTGRAVTISLFSKVQGTGSNSVFTIVGFVGMRVMNVQPTGLNKHILVQPAVVVDRTAIAGGPNTSANVYQPVKLTR
jgi:Flp pilus assembly protein TadG